MKSVSSPTSSNDVKHEILSRNVCENKVPVHRTPCNHTLQSILHPSPLMLSSSMYNTTTTSLAPSSSPALPSPVYNLRLWTPQKPLTGCTMYSAPTDFLVFVWLWSLPYTSTELNILALSSLSGNIFILWSFTPTQKILGPSLALNWSVMSAP